MPRPLIRYPLNKGLDGAKKLSRYFEEEKNLLLLGIEPRIVQTFP
jgi:hypothetical protein